MNARGRNNTSDIMSTTTPRDKFDAAVRVIRSLPKNGSFQPSNEMMLKFYAFYKQATEGECTAPKPNFWDVVKKAKWEAWNKLGDMSKEEAMCCYVDQLKTIVEAMPQTQLVAEFVEKLGSFYELVDDRTFSEKFSCHEISCQNGDIPNGDIFDHSESSALKKVNGNLGHSTNSLSADVDSLIDVNSNCARLDMDEMAVLSDYSTRPVNGTASDSDSDDEEEEEEEEEEDDRNIGSDKEDDKSIEDKVDSDTPKSETSPFPPHGSQVTSDTDSDVEYCDTLDDLHKTQGNAEDGNSVTNGSDSDQVFSSSPVKQNNNSNMMTNLRKSADQALARITTQNNVTRINTGTPCGSVIVSSTHPFVYIPNRKCSTDSMHVNVPSRQSVSDVDHECAVNGIPQENPKSQAAVVASDAVMDVTAHGGEEEEEKHSRKSSRRVSSGGYGATSRNIPRGQGEMGYCPSDQHVPYQVSNTGRSGRPGGEAPERPPPNITEQITIALSRLQSDLDTVLQRLDTLEKTSQKDKVSYSWWPFPEVSMKTFLFFAMWPIVVHYVFHMASKRKSK